MKEKELISKWLNHELTEEELEVFKKMDTFSSLNSISETATLFAAPRFNSEESYAKVQSKLDKDLSPKKISLWKSLSAAAAVIVICISLYFVTLSNKTQQYIAENSTKIEFVLPDASQVDLNAGSIVTYQEKEWRKNRTLQLEGEAFFKVEKGSKFTVETPQGAVQVLGTEFNVKNRKGIFEVVCFEGLVSVTYKNQKIEVNPGFKAHLKNNELVLSTTNDSQPDWLLGYSNFKSTPVIQVIKEIERQFNVSITTDNFDLTTRYTGSISHQDLATAIKAISIPLQLEVSIENNKVTLKK